MAESLCLCFQSAEDKKMSKDHFMEENGICFAGVHLLLDLYEAKRLEEISVVEKALKDAIQETRSTLLHLHVHPFGVGQGVSGVAVLAESHISIHTWPERQFAALDLFMCGHAKPSLALPVFKQAFSPGRIQLQEIKRGVMD
jgi:S-adenosylmethionine decarboxylase